MTTDASATNLVRMATGGLRLEPPPTEIEIKEMLDRLAGAFGATPQAVEQAQKILHSRFAIRMQIGETLTGEQTHHPWLDARRASITPFYWDRYYQYLLHDDWPPLVATTLGRSTNELLDLLGDPKVPGAWKRRGLVVGDVQSGKTASYAALICKAADAGYPIVILLSGTLENVRRQTQERLDASFVGLDSSDFLTKGQLKHKTYIGVGRINGERDGIVFTSSERDFKADIVSALNISLGSVREPVLVVAKKNKGVLTNLAAWLRAKNADRHGKIDLPLLLIDDEADNASINTRNRPNQTTAINAAIRDILGLFTRSSYVGFTATPFANIFIDPDTTDQMLGEDLFPRDFIHLLEAPDNYVGMGSLFGPLDPDDPEGNEAASRRAGLRTIDDSDDWLPVDHKRDDHMGELPETLRDAVRYFLLTCAVRDLRAKASGQPEKHIHRSMLVNVSRFTDKQNAVAAQIEVELDLVRAQVRLYGKLAPVEAARRSQEIEALRDLFAEELGDCGNSWPDVLSILHDSISPVRVQPVNQGTGAKSLDYRAVKEPPGLRVIAVGGNSLSRGLTLEDLSVSYFLRNSKAYDTLLQMGRWFGYRPGYPDLCRIWMSVDAERWYRHITQATTELKHDFKRMKRRKASPSEFGLRVRTHPGALLITARNKMATGVNIVGAVCKLSLAGLGIETATLPADTQRNEHNLDLLDQFLSEMASELGKPKDSPTGQAVVWYQVPAARVGDLLDEFFVHPFNHDFQADAIADFLKEAAARNDPLLSHWTVAVPTGGSAKEVRLPKTSTLELDAKKRRVIHKKGTPQYLLVSGKSARVGSIGDARFGMSKELVEQAAKEAKEEDPDRKQVPEDAYRKVMTNPLLIIYLLRGYEREGKKGSPETAFKDNLVLPALGMHFPGMGGGEQEQVVYRLNKVAQEELELDGDDLEDEDDDD